MGYVLRRVALKLYNYYAKVFAVNYLSTTLEGAYLCYVLTGGFLPMDVVFFSFSILFCDHQRLNYFLKIYSFLTRELRACVRASYRYDVGNGIRSLARSIGRFL